MEITPCSAAFVRPGVNPQSRGRMDMLKRALLCFFLALCLPLAGCQAASPREEAASYTRFSRRQYDIFDTEITLLGYAPSQEAFDRAADDTMAQLRELHQLMDGYNAYGDLHNLYYVNSHAAQEPVEVPPLFFDLLLWCRDQWRAGYRETNIAMGAVLKLWHDCRTEGLAHPETARIPAMDDLQNAAQHVDFDSLILDEARRTVYFTDPLLRLDLGAVAKGYAADVVLPGLMEEMPSFLLSLGGNVYAGNPPLDGRDHWNVGVQDPKADAATIALGGTNILDILEVNDLTVVTSGDYWRYYIVDGEKYHHIIDPDTLMPSQKMISVTVACKSSLLADYLSTTLFILSYEDGARLIEGMEGVEVMWVEPDGTIRATPGMAQYSRNLKTTP